MAEHRPKKYSADGWKYINADGTLWPKNEWIRYSAKHPKPLTAVIQAQDDPDLLKDKAPYPWNIRPDPVAPRHKIPVDQWDFQEDGNAEYLARIRFVRLPPKKPVPDPAQTKVTDYMQYKTV